MQSAALIVMESLSVSDLELLNWGICEIYSLRHVSTFGVDTLSIIHRIVPCDRPLYQQTNLRTRSVAVTLLPDDSQDLPEYTRLVNEVLPQYLHEHPIFQNWSFTSEGVYTISDFLSQEELHQCEGIYQQFLRPLQIEEQMQFFLPIDQPGDWLPVAQRNRLPVDVIQTGFILNHGSRSFTERDRLMLTLIRPHLALAYGNIQRYEQLQQNLESLQKTVSHLDLMIVDTDGLVMQATAQSVAWLKTYFPTMTDLDRLPDRLWAWVNYRIASLSNPSDLVPPWLPLSIEQYNKRLSIRLVIEPDSNQYLLLLEEQLKSKFKSLDILGLSQRETEVLGLVMKGKDNNAIAAQLDIGPSTIRKHLENIYRKFGVQSRTEAIAYALNRTGILS